MKGLVGSVERGYKVPVANKFCRKLAANSFADLRLWSPGTTIDKVQALADALITAVDLFVQNVVHLTPDVRLCESDLRLTSAYWIRRSLHRHVSFE
jgi:hypothetical protein